MWQSNSKSKADWKTPTTKRPSSTIETQFRDIRKKSRNLPAASAYLVPPAVLVPTDRRRLFASQPVQISIAAPDKAEKMCHLMLNHASTHTRGVLDACNPTISREVLAQPRYDQTRQNLKNQADGCKLVLEPSIGNSDEGSCITGARGHKLLDECPSKLMISQNYRCVATCAWT